LMNHEANHGTFRVGACRLLSIALRYVVLQYSLVTRRRP
jgi:hypothetical protein